MPNDDFYRIDTALVVPQVAVDSWKLSIDGLVDNPMELTFQDLLDRPQIERYITLSCVSNPVGGDLVGNALWQGVRLADILDEAGLQEGAEQVVSRSIDGWTCGSPIEAIMDGRDAMLAIAMNGEPLPAAPRLPGADRRARAVRLRLGHQVGHRHPADPLGGLRRLLGAARLVETRSGEDHGADRHTPLGGEARRPRVDRRCRVGGAPWRVGGRGAHRRGRVAAGANSARCRRPTRGCSGCSAGTRTASRAAVTLSRCGRSTATASRSPRSPRPSPPTAPRATTASPSTSPDSGRIARSLRCAGSSLTDVSFVAARLDLGRSEPESGS